MRIGVLTGGGDCPGLNAVIRSVVRTATTHYDSQVVGFRDGWRGLLEDRTTPLDIAAVDGLLTRGGTTLGSARVAPERLNAGIAEMKGVLARHGIDVLIPQVAPRVAQPTVLAVPSAHTTSPARPGRVASQRAASAPRA